MKLEEEKKNFENVYMYVESYKKDIEKMNEKMNIKHKFDIKTVVLGVFSILFFVLGIFLYPIFMIVSIILLMVLYYFRKKLVEKRRIVFFERLEKVIEKNKPEGGIVVSALYPCYIKYSNEDKIFEFIYQDKEYIKCDYSDIQQYNIYIDRFKTGKRLPDIPDKTISNYILEIVFKNNLKVEIGFSNANKYLKLDKAYIFQQYTNTKSINKIALLLDRIMKKNKI